MSHLALLALVTGAALATVSLAPTAEARALPRSTVKARETFFGGANVDRRGHVRDNRVIVSWFGIASLAVSFKGRVVLLDNFVNNYGPTDCPPSSDPQRYVPTSYRQLAALRPAAIFVGHEHFDHLCRVGELIARTGAKLVGLPQACKLAADELASYRGKQRGLRCAATLSSFSPFGKTRELRPLGRRLKMTVIRNLHSSQLPARS
jgi:hypothetical protein